MRSTHILAWCVSAALAMTLGGCGGVNNSGGMAPTAALPPQSVTQGAQKAVQSAPSVARRSTSSATQLMPNPSIGSYGLNYYAEAAESLQNVSQSKDSGGSNTYLPVTDLSGGAEIAGKDSAGDSDKSSAHVTAGYGTGTATLSSSFVTGSSPPANFSFTQYASVGFQDTLLIASAASAAENLPECLGGSCGTPNAQLATLTLTPKVPQSCPSGLQYFSFYSSLQAYDNTSGSSLGSITVQANCSAGGALTYSDYTYTPGAVTSTLVGSTPEYPWAVTVNVGDKVSIYGNTGFNAEEYDYAPFSPPPDAFTGKISLGNQYIDIDGGTYQTASGVTYASPTSLSVSPKTVSLPGTSSFAVTNSTITTANLIPPVLSGKHAGDFQVTPNSGAVSLGGGQSQSYSVTYSGNTATAEDASLAIASDCCATVKVTLKYVPAAAATTQSVTRAR